MNFLKKTRTWRIVIIISGISTKQINCFTFGHHGMGTSKTTSSACFRRFLRSSGSSKNSRTLASLDRHFLRKNPHPTSHFEVTSHDILGLACRDETSFFWPKLKQFYFFMAILVSTYGRHPDRCLQWICTIHQSAQMIHFFTAISAIL